MTSCMSSMRSNQLSYAPLRFYNDRYYNTFKTKKQVFLQFFFEIFLT